MSLLSKVKIKKLTGMGVKSKLFKQQLYSIHRGAGMRYRKVKPGKQKQKLESTDKKQHNNKNNLTNEQRIWASMKRVTDEGMSCR